MLTTLNQIVADPDASRIDHLTAIICALRPPAPDQTGHTVEAIRVLTQLLRGNPMQASALRHYLLQIYAARRQSSLYTDTGILPNAGFFTELFQRISFRCLPPALDDSYLRDTLDRVLPVETDYRWIKDVPAGEWLRLFEVIEQAQRWPDASDDQARSKKTLHEIVEALQTVSYRVTAMGLEPSLIRLYPGIEDHTSPFLTQNFEIHQYLDAYRAYLEQRYAVESSGQPAPERTDDARHLHVMLDQCELIVGKIRKNALRMGSSVSLTYLLVRLDQNITRMRRLLALIEQEPATDAFISVHLPQVTEAMPGWPESDYTPVQRKRQLIALELAQELIEAHNRKYAVRELFAENINLLARNVTENASKTGQHYIAENRRDFLSMFRSAAGAGVIIGFMAVFKILYYYLRTAPLVEAFLFSMNYSFGFMLIHLLHFTVATKQPAMTASHIARSLQISDQGKNVDLESLRQLIIKVLRTQFIAVAGNLLTVAPMAYLIAFGYGKLFGHDLVTPVKAASLLHDLDPLHSLALPHAAIAGVCLFLAGLISGYYDNKAAYTRMGARVRRLDWLVRWIGAPRVARLADYLEDNLGGLMGNFYFGVMLGTIGTIGFLVGLPLDIRHITFSAANLTISIAGMHNEVIWPVIVKSAVGVILIGLVNLWVSFSLALFVALRARRVRFRHGVKLARVVLAHFFRRPRDFFYPPRDAIPEAVQE